MDNDDLLIYFPTRWGRIGKVEIETTADNYIYLGPTIDLLVKLHHSGPFDSLKI